MPNGKKHTKTYVATVVTTHYVEVQATDNAHARVQVERRLSFDFGGNRSPKITNVEVMK